MIPTDYNRKSNSYFNEWREDIFNILQKYGPVKNSLEVGCGSGLLSRELKKASLVKNTFGVEPYAQLVLDNGFDKFIKGSLEQARELMQKSDKYELIILADVLEHTVDPWDNLNSLVNNHLSTEGIVVISLPNIRNFITLKKILFSKRFDYVQDGVLDSTHLRFFCMANMIDLVNGANLNVVEISPAYSYKSFKIFTVNRLRIINFLTLGIFKWLLADQIIIVGKNKQ